MTSLKKMLKIWNKTDGKCWFCGKQCVLKDEEDFKITKEKPPKTELDDYEEVWEREDNKGYSEAVCLVERFYEEFADDREEVHLAKMYEYPEYVICEAKNVLQKKVREKLDLLSDEQQQEFLQASKRVDEENWFIKVFKGYRRKKTVADEFSVEHLVPKSKGGTDNIDNLVPSCRGCNSSKGGKKLEDFRLFLEQKKFGEDYGVKFSKEQIKFLWKTMNIKLPTKPIKFWFEKTRKEFDDVR